VAFAAIKNNPFEGYPEELVGEIQRMPGGRAGIPDDSPHADRARELEYGTLTEPPSALMRTSERKARQEAEAVFTEVFHEELFG
jgi:hypothetical protein